MRLGRKGKALPARWVAGSPYKLIAGAQEKTAFLFHEGQWCKPIGTTPTTHIFKPQIGALPNGIDLSNSVENEFFCLDFLRRYGLPTAKAQMATFGKTRVLIVERFDRLATKEGRLLRIPQEDMCQALSVPWTLKYESHGGPGIQAIMQLLRGSDEPQEDRYHFIATMVLFWLLAATDGHAKNFSLFLYPQGGYRLTPLYDVLSVQPSYDARQIQHNRMKLAMAAGDRRHYPIYSVVPRHFIQSAMAAGLTEPAMVRLLVHIQDHARQALDETLAALPEGFPEAMAQSIAGGVRARCDQITRYLQGEAG